ncbi:hypothetical protein [Kineococcus indalonis]|uniref:hypothetical protein n=1 Tax=Kineococcus indalonis TaxID=2696566 RepID=UPI001412E80B|nr:hypothetical protein [Kineococcus indalonis]NAZ86242.1 hypothetical protein [Kineococcus indalonis]
MEPFLQLDPATLSVWYNPLPEPQAADGVFGDVAGLALRGHHADAAGAVRDLEGTPYHARAAHVLSAVWHEQRHFVDLLLTCYGQATLRQYWSVAVNLGSTLRAARAAGTLVLPVTAYSDPLRSTLLGARDPDLRQVGADARNRRRAAGADEASTTPPGQPPISVGGRAQLEALGYLHQMAALQTFGMETAERVQGDLPDLDRVRREYQWALFLGLALGFHPADAVSEQQATVLVPPVAAVLYASLMVRRYGQDQTADGSSYLAVRRLDALVAHFRTTSDLHDATTSEEAWATVDGACRTLFGRSATEELLADLEHQERFCSTARDHLGAESPVAAQSEVGLDARRRLVAMFLEDPALLLAPDRFFELTGAVAPVPVFTCPSGFTGVEEGWTSLWDRGSGNVLPDWCWAKAPLAEVGSHGRVDVIGDPAEWALMTTTVMPVVKLLLSGRAQQAVLAPEVRHAEDVLLQQGVRLRFDPLFTQPRRPQSAQTYWYFSDREEAVCDKCSSVIPRGGGKYVNGSTFRSNEAIRTWVREGYGGGPVAAYQFDRDWSSWLVCDPCAREVSRVVDDGGPELERRA